MTHKVDTARKLLADGYLLLRVDEATWSAIDAAADAAYRFFRRPMAEKGMSVLPEDCGYRPTGIEYSQDPNRPDPIESFTASMRTVRDAARLPIVAARILHEHLLEVFGVFAPLAEALTTRVADAVADSGALASFHGAFDRWSCVQVNYSRPAETVEGCIHEPHEDGHLWTFAHATAPGLEVATASGDFLAITTGAREVIVMPGEVAHLLSGGCVRPLYHRVRPDRRHGERLAVLFFADMAPALCQPWLRNDVNAGIAIGARVRSNATRFGLSGFTPE